MNGKLPRPGRYRHFKGNEYEVIGIARHSETTEPMVVYRALYGEGGLWVRPLENWNTPALLPGGRTVERFSRLGDMPSDNSQKTEETENL
ncbi:MAG TPA: DUF1653 domain-containing protein [Clostridiales bacterium]|nr:DUF1653 domain-containing protein [Clostridiales bacterium]